MLDKYYVFHKMLTFVDDGYDVTDADMNNYCGDIEITGVDVNGAAITIKVSMTEPKEEKTDGN